MADPLLTYLLGKYLAASAAGMSNLLPFTSLDIADSGTLDSTELLTNGNFAATTGWTQSSCTLTVASNQGTVTETSASITAPNIRQAIATVIGERYRVSALFKGTLSSNLSGAGASLRIGTSAGGSQLGIYYASSYTADETLWVEFVATGTTTYIHLYHASSNAVVGVSVWESATMKKVTGGAFYSRGTTYLGGVANGVKITAGGEITLEGTATVWNDVQFGIASGKVPASNFPTWEALTTNINKYSFAVDDYIDLDTAELEHWWKEGTAGNIHLHLTIKTANTSGADRFAKFTVYIATNGGATWAELTPLSAEVTIPNGAAALTKYYLDMGDASFTGFTIGTQLSVRVKRIAATGGTEYGANVFITQVGCHLEQDSLGSKTEAAK